MITIILSGCINSNQEANIEDGSKDDLKLSLLMDYTTFQKNTSNIELTLILENIKDASIYVEKRFDLGSNLKIELTSPKGNQLRIIVESGNHKIERKLLGSNEVKEIKINLKDLIIYNESKIFEWDEYGIYEIRGVYTTLSNERIDSELLHFEIMS